MNNPTPPPPPRRRRWLRALLWGLAGLLGALLLALAGVWIWAGTEGSLATALRWVGGAQPLVAEGVSGSLRGAGQARRLTWERDGLRVQVDDAELRWTPAALLGGTLQIDHLSARRIEIDDHGAAGSEHGPPSSLALPLKLQVRRIAIGELRSAGPPHLSARDIAARFDYDGARHLLTLDLARIEGGVYQARAAVTAHAPLRVDLALTGALTTPPAGGARSVPLTVRAALQGPLADLRAEADLRAAAPAGGASTPEAHASARIAPWAAQPLPEAHVHVRALDLGALWADAPATDLSGQFDLTPEASAGWALQSDIANAAPGPWDQRRLPLDSARADVRWADGVATVRALSARVGAGTVEARGRWAAAAQDHWQIDARVDGLDPAALHTALRGCPVAPSPRAQVEGRVGGDSAKLRRGSDSDAVPPTPALPPQAGRGSDSGRLCVPLYGAIKVSGAGAAIDFDAALQARAGSPPRPPELQAVGRWDQGRLTLNRLRLRAAGAELAGQADLDLRASFGGSADLALTAPGLALTLKGQLQPGSGGGALHADLRDAARLLDWARTLPVIGGALAGARADGHATLHADWRGGWRDPALQAHLSAPRLDWHGAEPPLQARGLDIKLAGALAQARLDVAGQIARGALQADLRLAASGGRATPRAALAQSGWRVTLDQLRISARDTALNDGDWQLATRAAVPFTWSPQDGGRFEAGAGQLMLATAMSPPNDGARAATAQAGIDFGPVRWRAGELSSAGRITGVPLDWIERLAGARLADAGLMGDVMLNGDWDADLGRQPRLAAHLRRVSGDLAVSTADPQAGVMQRSTAAGLREARLALASDGQALNLQFKWDSAQAGAVDAALRTELSAERDARGRARWHWPESAPLQGELHARLPQLSVWSVLAPPGWRLRGALSADARLGGTRAAPLLQGTLSADDLALRSVVDGVQFGAGRLRARLDGARLLIDEFVLHGAGAQDSGGALRASGQAGWIDGRAQARLTATLDKLRASIRADRQLTVSGSVRAALDGRQLQADGRLRVDRARIALPDESAPRLGDDVSVRGADDQALSGLAVPEAARQSNPLNTSVNVQIDLGDDFRLHGMGIDTRLAGALTLAASGPLTAMPRLTGAIRTAGGSVRAYSQQLDISRGNIVFSGEAGNPALDILALRPNHASDQRVGVQVMGTALLPRVRLYSQPQLPDNETLAWLLLGHAAPSSGAESAMLQSAALALLSGREGGGLAARFGLEELSFLGGSEGTVAGASVALGKRLSDRLYAAYEQSLSGASGTLMIFYELSRRWTLRGQTNENGAVDLVYRLSFD